MTVQNIIGERRILTEDELQWHAKIIDSWIQPRRARFLADLKTRGITEAGNQPDKRTDQESVHMGGLTIRIPALPEHDLQTFRMPRALRIELWIIGWLLLAGELTILAAWLWISHKA